MIRPEDCAVGSFEEASGLVLMLPRSDRDETILISEACGEKMAIYLGQHKYDAYPCGDTHSWKGLLVSGVSIEVDPASIFDPDREDPPHGSLIRARTGLDIIAEAVDTYNIKRTMSVGIMAGLPPSGEHCSAGFRRWQIVLGEGDQKRVLMDINIKRPMQIADSEV